MKFACLVVVLVSISMSACGPAGVLAARSQSTSTSTPSQAVTHTPAQTLTPTSTFTPSVTPTPTWIFQRGSITCPILLYHHIAVSETGSRYYVSPEEFAAQMQALHEWGYTTITMTRLVEAITLGSELPARPIVITFDDGDADVFVNAFPIMQQFGFTGVVYIVGKYMGADDFMRVEDLQVLVDAGWEIGSHGMHHIDLTVNHERLTEEIPQSRAWISTETGYRVTSFAYPFGMVDASVASSIARNGYSNAVGLGESYQHDLSSIFYLHRIEVRSGTSIEELGRMLPYPDGST